MRFIYLRQKEDCAAGYFQIYLPVPIDHPKSPRMSKCFHFNDDSDKPDALEEAQRWREETGSQLWGKFWPMILNDATSETPRRQHSRNTSGIIGVRCRTYKGYQEWVAQWREFADGKYKGVLRSFSVKKYGFEEAKRRAIEARENGILEAFYRRATNGEEEDPEDSFGPR